jgi:hypothetical protein
MLEVAGTINGARSIRGAGVIAGLNEIERDMLAGAGAKPGRKDFASAKMSVVALPAAISMISKNSVARSLAIGLLSKLPKSGELKRLRSSADLSVFVGSETATHELRL